MTPDSCAAEGRAERDAAIAIRPVWVRARIDYSRLSVVSTLAYEVAKRWVSIEAANRFSRAAATTAATVVARGEATMNL